MKILISMILVVAAVALTTDSAFAVDRCNKDANYSQRITPSGNTVWECKYDKRLSPGGSDSWYYFCSATYMDSNGNPVYTNTIIPNKLTIAGTESATVCTIFRIWDGSIGTSCSNFDVFDGDSLSIFIECG